MIENKEIMDAIRLLGVDCFSLSGHTTNETEFLSMYKEKKSKLSLFNFTKWFCIQLSRR